jgi:hypothetical protein
MMIYSSWYGNKEIATTGIFPVGISLYPPRWKTAFKVRYRIRDIAPTQDMLEMEYGPYFRRYIKQLEGLDIVKLQKNFKEISANGAHDIVLLCFEDINKEGEWCHRRMFAEWWHKKTGQKIEEIH